MKQSESIMSIIVFLRHGQTDWNIKSITQGREDIPLNETGINQAKVSACDLAVALDKTGFRLDKIYTSPLSRANDTAKIISSAIGNVPVIADKRLIERDFGNLSGMYYDKNSPTVLRDTDDPTVETRQSLIDRVNSLIKDEVKGNENVLFVTHGAITRIYAMNAKKSIRVAENEIGIMGNCSLVVYSYDEKEPILIGYDIKPIDFDIKELL